MIDPLIVRVVTLALGLLLVGAAWHKLASAHQFAAVLEDYQLLPRSLAPWFARGLPWLEIMLGLGLIGGFASSIVVPATATLFGIYAIAIAINLGRGRVHISCGCGLGGHAKEDQPLSWLLVLRNMVLIAAALLPLVPVSGRPPGLSDWLMLALALLAAGVLYLAASQLLQNQASIRSWRTAGD